MAYPTELIRRARENGRMKKPPVRRETPEGEAERVAAARAPCRAATPITTG